MNVRKIFIGLIVTLISIVFLGNSMVVEAQELDIFTKEKVKEIISDSSLSDSEKTNKIYSSFEGLSQVSYGYFEDGEKIIVQNKLSRAVLDSAEYTPYSFRVDLNGYWAEGQMPVLKMDGEVVFCIEPGVAAIAGDGYTPMTLPSNIREKMVYIATFGYNIMGTHESYLTSQGYIWELMGASFTTSYNNYTNMKKQIDSNIENYFIRPSFNGQTITLKVGELFTLTDTNNVLSQYVEDVSTGGLILSKKGNQLTISANNNSNDTAQIRMWKATQTGTSIAYQKAGSQTVAKFRLSDPTDFTVNVNVIKTGDIEIDKTTVQYGKSAWNNLYSFQPILFDVVNDAGTVVDTVTLDATGYGKLKQLVQGKYILKEKSSDWSKTGQTIASDIQTTIVAGKTVTVTPKNTAVTGQITVKKEGVESAKTMWNSSYTLAGNVFEIASTDGKIKETITTNTQGIAITSNKLPLGEYTVKEIQASDGFINTFTDQKVTLTYKDNKTELVYGEASGKNQEITGSSKLEKSDKGIGNQTQGLATFLGAQYTLYDATTNLPIKWDAPFKPQLDGGKQLDGNNVVIEVDKADGIATIGVKHLAINNYYWQETKAPFGYQKDATKHHFSIKKKDDKQAVIVADLQKSKEKIITFNINAWKFLSKGSSSSTAYDGINDVAFTLTPTDGTKGKAQTIKTKTKDGYDGYLDFSNVPIGNYILEEVEAPESYAKINPIKISVTEKEGTYTVKATELVDDKDSWERTYSFTQTEMDNEQPIVNIPLAFLDDKLFEAQVKVTKIDAETKKVIPLKDTTFKIYDTKSKTFIQDYVPNTDQITNEFKTNSDGYFYLTQPLPFGKDRYELIEVSAPEGYDINNTPLKFSVTQSNSKLANDGIHQVVEVEFSDTPSTAKINLNKLFEAVTTVTTEESDFGKVYSLNWDFVDKLAGATFDVFANEDIVTNDGTVKYKKDEKVETITTDNNGFAKTKALYVGKAKGQFKLVETKAPNGFTLIKEPIFVDLTWDSINFKGLDATTEAKDSHQTLSIQLLKEMQKVDGFTQLPSTLQGLFILDEEGNPILDEDGNPVLEDTKKEVTEEPNLINVPAPNKTFGLITLEDINGQTEKGKEVVVKKESLLGVYKTDKQGVINVDIKLPHNISYVFVELDAGENYILDKTNYEFHYVATNNNEQVPVLILSDKQLVGDDVTNYKDAKTPILNQVIPPTITSEFTIDGEKEVYAGTVIETVDKVPYEHLEVNEEYTFSQQLMVNSNLLTIDGEVFENSIKVTPEKINGVATINTKIDTNLLSYNENHEAKITSMIRVYDAENRLVAHHEVDLLPEQTVTVKKPVMETEAQSLNESSVSADKHIMISLKENLLQDTFSYEGAIVGKELTMRSKALGIPNDMTDEELQELSLLLNPKKEDEKELEVELYQSEETKNTVESSVDEQKEATNRLDELMNKLVVLGEESLTFIPKEPTGTETIPFKDIPKEKLNGIRAVVFFEEGYSKEKDNNRLVVKETDPINKKQTVNILHPEINTTALALNEIQVSEDQKTFTLLEKNKIADIATFKNVLADMSIDFKMDVMGIKKGTTEQELEELKTFYAKEELTSEEAKKFEELSQKLVLIGSKEETITTTEENSDEGNITIELEDIAKDKFTDIEKIVIFETGKDEKGNVILEEKDPTSKAQSIAIAQPTIQTKAQFSNGESAVVAGGKKEAVDILSMEGHIAGTTSYIVTQAVDKEAYLKYLESNKDVVSGAYFKEAPYIIATTTTEYTAKGDQEEVTIKQELNTDELIDKEIVYFEYEFAEKELVNNVATHADINSTEQSIKVVREKKDLPNTGTKNSKELMIFGAVVLFICAATVIVRLNQDKKNDEEEEQE